MYLAPEITAEKLKDSYEKSSIYSLGLIILELNGMDSKDFYSIKSGDTARRQNKIKTILLKSSEQIQKLVPKMLLTDPNSRPSLSEIWDTLSQGPSKTAINEGKRVIEQLNTKDETKQHLNPEAIDMKKPCFGNKVKIFTEESNINHKIQYANGDSYSGKWLQNARHGNGEYIWSKNSNYVGDWKENKRDGHGVMHYSNNDEYDGSWKDDLFSGQGIYQWANGRKYEGNFERGVFHGQGKIVYENGDWYDGEWAEDCYEGEGIYYSREENMCYKGKFHKGEIIEIISSYIFAASQS